MNRQWERIIQPDTSQCLPDERYAGGKGLNLLRLIRQGLPVPPFFVISSGVFDALCAPCQGRIDRLLAAVDYTDRASVAAASERIGDIVEALTLPDDLLGDLSTAVSQAFGDHQVFAVRSSIVGEDSHEHSFAGQMDTVLNVRREELAGAIRRVWASAFSERALAYRQCKGLAGVRISAAVIIQEQITSAISGVMFTRHPENRAPECVIAAGYGLGEGVVSNQVEADTYRIGQRGRRVSAEVRRKPYLLAACPDGRAGSTIEPVPAALQDRPALTERQVRRLRGLGVRLERHFGTPQDIEWALDACGRLYVLQARPIVFRDRSSTDSHRPPAEPAQCEPTTPLHVWDNANIVESYPGLTKPLTFSFIRCAYETSFRRAMEGFLLFRKPVREHDSVFRSLLGLLDGRVYYDVLNWYRMLSLLPGFDRHKGAWDQMIGISHRMNFPHARLSRSNRIGTAIRIAWRLLTVSVTARRFLRMFQETYHRFGRLDIPEANAEGLIRIYDALGGELKGFWHLTLFNDFCAMKYYAWLKALCERWIPGAGPNLHNNLLAGQRGVESVAPVASLLAVVRMCRANPHFMAAIDGGDDLSAWDRIQRSPDLLVLKEALDLHLDRYGDRGLEELKLETSTFREAPERLVGLLRGYCRLETAARDGGHAKQALRRDAEQNACRILKNPVKRLVFWFVLRQARSAVTARENMRFARTRFFGIVRRVFRRMGEILVAEGVLASRDDIWYLTLDEVFGFVQGAASTRDLTALARLRRAEYATFARRSPGERITTSGSPYLCPLVTDELAKANGRTLSGIGCSSGIAEGIACVAPDPHAPVIDGNMILIAKSTDPGWVFLMIASRGIVVEKGSVLSHTGIIGRELGIPTIVGAEDATRLIPHGVRVRMDGSTGEVRW